jgi:predicted MFS family arabinose efflux permease
MRSLIDARLLTVFGAAFAAFINLHPVQALGPALLEAFAADAAAVGQVVAASLLSVALAAPFIGALSEVAPFV